MSENEHHQHALKIGMGVWVCFCALVSIYVFSRFLRGKRRVFNNLHVVEESLRRMQEALDVERRKKSIGVVDSLEEIVGGVGEGEEEEEGAKEVPEGAAAAGEEGAAASSLPEEEPLLEEEEEDKKNV